MTYEERLRMTGQTKKIKETRRLRVDILEVYNILKVFEGSDEMKFFQRRVGSTRGHDLNSLRNEFN